MTLLEVVLTVPAADGEQIPASGVLRFAPTRRRVLNGTTVLPKPFQVPLTLGMASVDLAANDVSWVWRIDEHVSGVPARTIYANVPDAVSVLYTDLVAIDPATLAPTAELTPAWAAQVDAKLDANKVGAANGVAPLGADSKVADANLPTRLGAAALDAKYTLKGEAGGGAGVTFVTLTGTGQAVTIPTGSVAGLALTQGTGGSKTASWPAGIRWDGGTAPTLATTAGATDVFTFVLVSAGSWLGSKSGTYAAPADVTAPSAVTGLTAGAATATSVPLSWTAATDNVGIAGYEYSTNGTTYTATGSTGTSYTVTGLTGSTIYTLYVRAFDAVGNKGTAASVVKTTPAAPADSTAPSALTGLTAGTATTTTIPLTWTAATDNTAVTGYEYSTNGTTWVSTGSTATAYTVTGLSSATAYTVQVRAFDAAGNKGTAGSVSKTTAGLTQVFLDTFTRANGTLAASGVVADSGQSWAGSTAATYIDTNKLKPFTSLIYVTHGSASPAEGTCSITAPTTNDVKVSFRAPANSTTLDGALVNITAAGLVALSGAATTPATITYNVGGGVNPYVTIPGFVAGGTYAVKMTWAGATVALYIDGVKMLEGTYSGAQMTTLAGFTSIQVVGTTTARIDDLKLSA